MVATAEEDSQHSHSQSQSLTNDQRKRNRNVNPHARKILIFAIIVPDVFPIIIQELIVANAHLDTEEMVTATVNLKVRGHYRFEDLQHTVSCVKAKCSFTK